MTEIQAEVNVKYVHMPRSVHFVSCYVLSY